MSISLTLLYINFLNKNIIKQRKQDPKHPLANSAQVHKQRILNIKEQSFEAYISLQTQEGDFRFL